MNNAKRPDAVAALPAQRYVTVIAQDPSVRQNGSNGPILMAKIAVPAEDLIPGPIGYRVQVVDYDSTTRRFNGAHDLPDNLAAEPPAWAKGDARIIDDFRFHAQNVYALVMKTLARFEFALGRRVGWSFRTTSSRSPRTACWTPMPSTARGKKGLSSAISRARAGRRCTPASPTTWWCTRPRMP